MSYSSEVLADTPVWYGRLGESSGTTMTDASGNGRNGTYTGSPTLGVTGALVGDADTAITLNGTTQFGEVASNVAFQQATFTVEAWVKFTTTAVVQILNRHKLSQNKGFQFRVNAGKIDFFLVSAGAGLGVGATTTGTYNDGAWHHVVGTCDGTNLTVYVDGAQVKQQANANTQPVATDGLRVGVGRANGSDGTQGFFPGSIDEPAYYAGALSSTRILAHFTAGQPPAASGTGSLSLSGSGAAAGAATGTGSLSLSGSGAAKAAATGSGSLTLSAVGDTVPPSPASGTGSLSLSGSGTAGAGVTGSGSLSLSATGTGTGSQAASGTGSLSLDASGSATLADGGTGFLELSATGVAEVLYATDTSNLLNGRVRRARATSTVTRPAGAAPSNLATKYDKAVPLPPPTLVDGRVT